MSTSLQDWIANDLKYRPAFAYNPFFHQRFTLDPKKIKEPLLSILIHLSTCIGSKKKVLQTTLVLERQEGEAKKHCLNDLKAELAKIELALKQAKGVMKTKTKECMNSHNKLNTLHKQYAMLTRTSRNLDEATKKIEKNLSLLNSIDNSNQTDVPTQVREDYAKLKNYLSNLPIWKKDLSEDDEAAFPKALSQYSSAFGLGCNIKLWQAEIDRDISRFLVPVISAISQEFSPITQFSHELSKALNNAFYNLNNQRERVKSGNMTIELTDKAIITKEYLKRLEELNSLSNSLSLSTKYAETLHFDIINCIPACKPLSNYDQLPCLELSDLTILQDELSGNIDQFQGHCDVFLKKMDLSDNSESWVSINGCLEKRISQNSNDFLVGLGKAIVESELKDLEQISRGMHIHTAISRAQSLAEHDVFSSWARKTDKSLKQAQNLQKRLNHLLTQQHAFEKIARAQLDHD